MVVLGLTPEQFTDSISLANQDIDASAMIWDFLRDHTLSERGLNPRPGVRSAPCRDLTVDEIRPAPKVAAPRPPRRWIAAGDDRRARRGRGVRRAADDGSGRAVGVDDTWREPRDLVLYLETFVHTVGVMQTRGVAHTRRGECAEDLAADGVVYAEVRFAPELHIEKGLSLDDVVEAVLEGFRQGSADSPITVRVLCTAMRTAAPVAADRRARGAVARRRRVRLRHRRRGGGLPTHAAPRCLPVRDARELPHHHPRGRGVRAALDLGSAAVLRRRTTRPRRAHRRRHRRRHRDRRRRPEARSPGQLRP